MSLLALQTAFRAWLPGGRGKLPAVFDQGCDPGLRVYRNNYRAQLIKCLEHSFPRTREWLGSEAFLSACSTHVDQIAPVSWTIDAYALGLLPTLATLYPNDPEIPELAWLEWALGEAFVSRDEQPVSAEDLGHIDWDNAILHFARSVTVATARTNAGEIWAALAADQTAPGPSRVPSGSGYLVWRQGFQGHFRTLDPQEHAALVQMRAGAKFGHLCELLVETRREEEAIELAGDWLGRWINDGLVARVGQLRD